MGSVGSARGPSRGHQVDAGSLRRGIPRAALVGHAGGRGDLRRVAQRHQRPARACRARSLGDRERGRRHACGGQRRRWYGNDLLRVQRGRRHGVPSCRDRQRNLYDWRPSPSQSRPTRLARHSRRPGRPGDEKRPAIPPGSRLHHRRPRHRRARWRRSICATWPSGRRSASVDTERRAATTPATSSSRSVQPTPATCHSSHRRG